MIIEEDEWEWKYFQHLKSENEVEIPLGFPMPHMGQPLNYEFENYHTPYENTILSPPSQILPRQKQSTTTFAHGSPILDD